jgi:hypothetical protein
MNGTQINTPAWTSISFGFQWKFMLPEVYRFENQQWIDEFFETGCLRLSNFAKFSTYDHEARGDNMEGQGLSISQKGSRSVGVWLKEGRNSFVLSCGLLPHKGIMEELDRNSAFVISDPIGFAAEIARQIPGVIGGFSGLCVYRDPPILYRDLKDADFPSETDSLDQIMKIGEKLGGEERYLIKHTKYELQREYRFIWQTDQPAEDYLDVTAPAARRFCRRIRENEIRASA